jgi:hypothetical protein
VFNSSDSHHFKQTNIYWVMVGKTEGKKTLGKYRYRRKNILNFVSKK